jgi:hypothetical protein
MAEKFKCPLCESVLSESNYYKIIGAWEEKSKLTKELKTKLASAEDTKKKLILEQQKIKKQLILEKANLKKQFEEQFNKQKASILKKAQEEAKKLAKKGIDKLNKEKLELERKISEEKKNNKKQLIEEKAKIQKQFENQRLLIIKKAQEDANKFAKKELIKATKEALEKGKKHEKKRTDRLSDMLKGNMEKLQKATQKMSESDKIIKELREQLKKGTTPQVEGLNLEEELVKELKAKFPGDEIIRKGHGGDIYHYVKYNNEKIGFIIYECKKTQKFQKNYVHQIKNDVVKQNATYGVLVTTASEKDKAGFWVRDGILIVHPYGTIYIAEVLRNWIINLYSLKLDKKELSECAKKLLEYIKGDKFKNCVEDTIDRTRQLNEMLKKEITTHKNLWENRHKHYSSISENSQNIEQDSKAILRNEEEEIKEIEEEVEMEMPFIISGQKKKKKKRNWEL